MNGEWVTVTILALAGTEFDGAITGMCQSDDVYVLSAILESAQNMGGVAVYDDGSLVVV